MVCDIDTTDEINHNNELNNNVFDDNLIDINNINIFEYSFDSYLHSENRNENNSVTEFSDTIISGNINFNN